MLTTSELRDAWSPACDSAALVRVDLVQGVPIRCHERTASAMRGLGLVMQAHRYVVRRDDTGAYNCRQITGGAGHSLHAFGIAVDVNWHTNPYRADNVLVTDMPGEMVEDILAIRTHNGQAVWRWGGHYRTVKDAMHYEVACSPDDLATGIDWATVRQPDLQEEEPSRWPLVRRGDRGPAVEELHRRLGVAAPGEPGFGTFGPRTEAAVHEYQRSRGLTADGIVGIQTWTALLTDQPEVGEHEPGPVKRQVSGAYAT
jgi:hypothetical protein